MRLNELGEFGLIERIRQSLPPPSQHVLVGIGDDVAVIHICDHVWLATCDTQVEGTHFLLGRTRPSDLGHKALAVNLSDIAATGGSPRIALVSLGLPDDLPVEFVDELYVGLREQAELYGVEIVGGNITRANLFVDVFVLGEAMRQDIVLRSGARPGDSILVTGALGDAAAGVALLLNSELQTSENYRPLARSRYDRPTPRVREGELIGRLRKATAMLDISDGLASDLGHICDSSQVGARLLASALPVAPENRELAQTAYGDEFHFALFGGEDYELLFTAAPGQAAELAQIIEDETGTRVSLIGEIVPEEEKRLVIRPDGTSASLEAEGWDHFKR